MKKPLLIIGTIIILVIAGISIFNVSEQKPSDDSSMMKPEENAMEKTENTTMTKSDSVMMDKQSGSRYQEYSSDVLTSAATTKRVLFFYANWCPTCRPTDANFRENENKIPEGVTLIRVNYNDTDTDQEEKDLAKKYGITYQHTFVQIDEKGNQVTKWNGGQINELLANIK